ncbi:MAG: four helix bundle protein [Pirellulales bacterium]
MSGVRAFTELHCWQRARIWSKDIFRETRESAFRQDVRLVTQINDSSESVMSNIAEGFGRGTQAEFILFLGYAIGSLDETKSHLCAAYDREYLAKPRFGELFREGTEIRKLTVALIRSMILPRGGVKTLGKRTSWSNEVWEIYERLVGKPRPEKFGGPSENGEAPAGEPDDEPS